MDASPSRQRKHKRSEAHEDLFQWLLGLQICDESGYLDEDEMSYLSHKYTRVQLENAFCHLQHKINKKGFKPKSNIAIFKHLLQNEHNLIGMNAEINEAFARKFANDLGWGTLKINEKYVIDKNHSAKDLSLNMEPAAFRSSLENLYMGIHGQFATG